MFYEINPEIRLCHGSPQILKEPFYLGGEPTNDYGPGFYTVSDRNIELAKEWACSPFNRTQTGYVNIYRFETQGLQYLNLDKFNIIYWIVLTATNRNADVDQEDLKKLQTKYLLDTSRYDCIYGWRCDDTYSRIINGFFDGNFSAEAIREATKLGHLQEQFVLISREAYKRIHFENAVKVNDFEGYRNRFNNRKSDADRGLRECRNRFRQGTYIDDYLADLTAK